MEDINKTFTNSHNDRFKEITNGIFRRQIAIEFYFPRIVSQYI